MGGKITDTNGNGVLDGEDLLAKLKAENSKGSIHQEVHGMLEVVGIQKVVKELYADLLKNHVKLMSGSITGSESDIGEDAIKKNGANKIGELLKSAANISEDKETSKDLEVLKDYIRHDLNLGNIERKIAIDDINNAKEFSRSFKDVFPKGVKILPKDVPEIMQQFTPKILVVTAKKEKNNDMGI